MVDHFRVEGQTCAVEAAPGDTLLRAALRAGLGFPYECNSGGCGSCKFELLSGTVRTLWSEAPGLSERDRQRKRHLACQSIAEGELAIRVRLDAQYLPRHVPRRRSARLIESFALTHDLREFRFATEAPAEFLAGQYASLRLPGVAAPRAYSMCNLANAAGQWHFQIRRVPGGQATAQLFERLAPGDAVEIDGPYGLAWLREDNARDIVCAAGGSGLSPMISIARGAAAVGLLGARKLHFFYGARTAHDVCGEVMLRELQPCDSTIRYHAVVSGTDANDPPWAGETGFVHDAVARHLGDALARHEFYFAGPPPMTQALQNLLMMKHRVPYGQIHFDRFF